MSTNKIPSEGKGINIAGVLMGVLAVGGVLFTLSSVARGILVQRPDLGDLGYRRTVFTLVDQTKSLDPEVRREIRRSVDVGVLPLVAPGDYAVGYRVDSDQTHYDEIRNRIFGDQRDPSPKVRTGLSLTSSLSEKERSELADQWNSLHGKQSIWKSLVDSEVPPTDACCSGYLAAVSYFESRIKSQSLFGAVTMIMLGDLYEETPPSPFVPPDAVEEDKRVYSDVRIWLVHPFKVRGSHTRQEIESFWRQYFSDRGGSDIHFFDFSGFQGLEPADVPPA